MDWRLAIEEERAALTRIVALLSALAGLAELAGSRSPAVRGFVLWLLRDAEAVARKFVVGDPDARLASTPVFPACGGPSDAMRLAASLRALARQLAGQAMLNLAAGSEDNDETEPSSFGQIPAVRYLRNALSTTAAFAWRAPHPVHAPDTS